MSNSNNKKNTSEGRIVRLETLFEGVTRDIGYIKKSIDNHIGTLTKRIIDLEKEMSKRWSRPEAVALGLIMSLITALLIYIITN